MQTVKVCKSNFNVDANSWPIFLESCKYFRWIESIIIILETYYPKWNSWWLFEDSPTLYSVFVRNKKNVCKEPIRLAKWGLARWLTILLITSSFQSIFCIVIQISRNEKVIQLSFMYIIHQMINIRTRNISS